MSVKQYVDEAPQSLETVRILCAIARLGAKGAFMVPDVIAETASLQSTVSCVIAGAREHGLLVADPEKTDGFRLTEEGRAGLADIDQIYRDIIALAVCINHSEEITPEDFLEMAWESIDALEMRVSPRMLRHQFTAIFAEANEVTKCEGPVGEQARRIQELVLKYAPRAQELGTNEDGVDAIRAAFLAEVKPLRAS